MALLITDPVDWRLGADGDLEIPIVFTVGLEAIRQGVEGALRLIRGELFFDRGAGMPWLENDYVTPREALLGHPFDAARIRAEVRRAVTGVPGVAGVGEIVPRFDSAIRTVRLDVNIASTFGATVPVAVDVAL